MVLYLVNEEHVGKLRRAKRNEPHNNVLIALWEEFGERYSIAHGSLPIAGKEKLLEPDFIFMDRGGDAPLKDRNMRYIIEVETGGGRKSIPGAAIIVDYCVKEHKRLGKQKGKPVLLFILLKDEELARKRINLLKGYFTNIDVKVFTPVEAAKFMGEAP